MEGLNRNAEEEMDEEEEEDIDYSKLIDQHHLELVTKLDLERQFIFSYLRSKSVLDEEDCEMAMNTGTTRQQKVSIFLDILKRKGDEGMKHFVDALEFEHAALYEKITGRKATTMMAPLPTCVANGVWNWTTGLAGKEYIDFDRMVLAKQLDQTVSDLHWVTRLLHKVQEEKNIIEKKYLEVHQNFELLKDYSQGLKEVIERNSEMQSLACENETDKEYVQNYMQAVSLQEILQRTNMIIALQAKMLAQTEELEMIRTKNLGLQASNEHLKKQVFDLTLKCDSERRQSKRLSAKVITQQDEKNQIENLKSINQRLRYKSEILTEERDDITNEFEEFRKYSEALNEKFNLIAEEKHEIHEHNEEIVCWYKNMKDQLNGLNTKCQGLQCDKDYLTRVNERLHNDIRTYRELQKTLYSEQERLRDERDEALKMKKKANEEVFKSKREHDESIHNQILINRSLDQQYSNVVEELDDLRCCLRETNEELIQTKKRSQSRQSMKICNDKVTMKESPLDESVDAKEAVAPESESDDRSSKSEPIPIKSRSRKDLLSSIKRKVSGTGNDFEMTSYTVPNKSASLKGLMSFQQIRWLYASAVSSTIPRTSKECIRSPNLSESSVDTLFQSVSSQPEHSSVSREVRQEEEKASNKYTRKKGKKKKNYNRALSCDSTPQKNQIYECENSESKDSIFSNTASPGSSPLTSKTINSHHLSASSMFKSMFHHRTTSKSLAQNSLHSIKPTSSKIYIQKTDGVEKYFFPDTDCVEEFRKRTIHVAEKDLISFNNKRRSTSAPPATNFGTTT